MYSAAILSGGQSSRMGKNKAFEMINGRRIIDIVFDKLRPIFMEITIVTNEPDLYREFPAEVITDIYPGLGPVAGIQAALSHAEADAVFVTGCDMPFVSSPLIQHMLASSNGYDAVVPVVAGRLQPTAAVYRKSALKVFTDSLKNQKLKLTRLFEELNALELNEAVLSQFGSIEEMFFNINDAAALEKARVMMERGAL